jgi:hypothetical protein
MDSTFQDYHLRFIFFCLFSISDTRLAPANWRIVESHLGRLIFFVESNSTSGKHTLMANFSSVNDERIRLGIVHEMTS